VCRKAAATTGSDHKLVVEGVGKKKQHLLKEEEEEYAEN